MKTIFYSLLLISLFSCKEKSTPKSDVNVASGRVERIENFQTDLVTSRNVDVYLPSGYTSEKKYPVLYMHDGQMLFDSLTTWNKQEWQVDEAIGEMIGKKQIPECIVVGVWNNQADRHSDYFPQKPFEATPKAFQDSVMNINRYADHKLFSKPVQSDNYLKFLATEVKPYIDTHYSTLSDRANTMVMGSSMGGLISMYAICEYPEVFGSAACLSTHWPGTFALENNPIPQEFMNYLESNLPDPSTHKIYFDYGTETLDSMYEPLQLKVNTIMENAHGWQNRWVTKKFEGHDHSERAWAKRLEIPVSFLFAD